MPASLLKSTATFLLFMALLFAVLGLPLDAWWKAGAILFALTIAALTQHHLSLRKKIMGAIICASFITLKGLLPIQYMEEGANVFAPQNQALKELPTPIYDALFKDFDRLYPNHNLGTDGTLYGFSMEQFHRQSSLSRQVTSVDFDTIESARFGFMNKNNYNTYYKMKPQRTNLPFFVRYDIPKDLADHPDTQICWKGNVFFKQKADYKVLNSPTRLCLKTSNLTKNTTGDMTFYGISVDPSEPLGVTIKPPLSQKLWLGLEIILGLLGALILLNLFYPLTVFWRQFHTEKNTCFRTIIMGGSLIFSITLALFYRPSFASGFLLFEGGNDALTYSTMARISLEAIFAGDWKAALMGGEAIFDLMPLHRYTYALNLYLFGETHFGYFILSCFFPLAIYALVRTLFQSQKWALVLGLLFATTPALEAFGFTQMYVVRLCMRGFAEPLSYLAFIGGVTLGLRHLRSSISDKNQELFASFLVGFCLFVAVGARPNVAPGAGIFLLCVTYGMLRYLQFPQAIKHITLMGFGFAPLLLIPLHNIYFGDQFVLFTIAGQKSENLVIQAQDYIAVLKGLMVFEIPFETLSTITDHLTSEIKPRQPWFYLVLLLSAFGLLSRRLSTEGKVLSLTGFAQLSIVLFYHVGGRYGYLHWTLLLLPSLMLLRNFTMRERA